MQNKITVGLDFGYLPRYLFIYFFVSNSNSLKGETGTTIIYRKYTRESLMYREWRTKLKKLSEIKNGLAIERIHL